MRVHRRFEACGVDFNENLLERFEKFGKKGLSVEELAYDVAKDLRLQLKSCSDCSPPIF